MPILPPQEIQIIGDFLALRWPDGSEDFIAMESLRAHSPSAETMGEKDLLGKQYGGDGPKAFPGVRVISWQAVGAYALAFEFSDGHRSGIYSFDYLKQIAAHYE